jgi:hypothetical protein
VKAIEDALLFTWHDANAMIDHPHHDTCRRR